MIFPIIFRTGSSFLIKYPATPSPSQTATSTPVPSPTTQPGPSSISKNTPSPGPTDTATPTPPGPTNSLIQNGDFERGSAAWQESSGSGYEIVDTTNPHSGSYSAYLDAIPIFV